MIHNRLRNQAGRTVLGIRGGMVSGSESAVHFKRNAESIPDHADEEYPPGVRYEAYARHNRPGTAGILERLCRKK